MFCFTRDVHLRLLQTHVHYVGTCYHPLCFKFQLSFLNNHSSHLNTQPYYYHPATSKTTWDRPAGAAAPAPVAARKVAQAKSNKEEAPVSKSPSVGLGGGSGGMAGGLLSQIQVNLYSKQTSTLDVMKSLIFQEGLAANSIADVILNFIDSIPSLPISLSSVLLHFRYFITFFVPFSHTLPPCLSLSVSSILSTLNSLLVLPICPPFYPPIYLSS